MLWGFIAEATSHYGLPVQHLGRTLNTMPSCDAAAGLCFAGHFDILMGKRVESEVFPLIHQFLLQHDGPRPRL
jgi:hypothetical protein